MVIASAGSPLQTQIYGKAFDKLTKYITGGYDGMGDFVADIRLLCGLIMVVGVVRMFFTWLSIHLWLLIGERQQERARSRLLSNLLDQNLEWYEQKENLMGSMAQVNRCIEEVRVALSENIALLVQGSSSIVLLLVSAFISSWSLTLVIMASAPLMALSSIIFGRLTFRFANEENNLSAKASKILDWSFVSGNLVRLLNGKYRDSVSFNQIVDKSAKAFIKMSLSIGSNQSILRVLSFLIFVQGFWFGAYMVSIGKLRVGQVLTAFSSCLILGTHVSTVANVLALLNKGQAAASTIAEFMEFEEDENKSIQDPEVIFDPILSGKLLQLEGVCFNYGASEKPNISNVSAEISNEHFTFIVGPSGCGKSTLVSLLMKFYSPSSGRISIDGLDISSLSETQVSSFITLVESNALVFDKSVYENIALGSREISEEKAMGACDFAELGTFVRSLENGIHSKISSSLSGGQMQRIGIARAYLKNSPILILDEALSAVDQITRQKLYENIRKWRKDRLTIIVSHELSDIADGDYVLSLMNGEVEKYKQQKGDTFGKQKTGSLEKFSSLEDSESIFTDGLNYGPNKAKDLEHGSNSDELQILSVFAVLKHCYHSIQSKLLIMIGLLLSLLSGIITPVLSFCFSKLLSNVVDQSTKLTSKEKGAFFWSSIVIGLIVFDGAIYFTSHFLLAFSSERWVVDLRKKALVIINDQDMSFFSRKYSKPAELTALLMNDARDLRNLVSEFLSAVLSLIALTLLGLIWSIVSGWKLALVGTAFVPLILLVTVSYGLFLSKFETRYKDKVGEVEKFNHNAVSGVKTVKAFGVENDFQAGLKTKLSELSSVAKLRACITGLGFALSEMCVSIATGAILYYGLYLVASMEYSYESMLQVLTLLTFTMASASTLMSSLPEIARGQRAGTLFAQLLSLTASPIETSGTDQIHKHIQSENVMSFENVSFRYQESDSVQKKVLQDLSFSIKRGEVVGIVGASGSGKSTIASLMGRLMDCDRGLVKYESKPVKTLDPLCYRRNVAVVPQRPKFFEGSIWENLLYGVDKAFIDKAFVVECLKLCNIWDLVSSMQHGLDTVLDERTVSSGQLQRLCIARVLIREPKMIVFDECTSNLDQANADIITDLIISKLHQSNPALAIVVITHDVEMMSHLPRLLVLKDGEVNQDGDFETLSSQMGEFKRLTT
ncbi:uncharacterized protein CXQ87_004822 [Candidozyma duobushaemuli]|uniref:Uncharacterized protein n=2 Tax=Candidozyma TaxID=3303203 RepID=A0ABX8IE38_9ASCO|nr:uncharacterized protein CXQ87_004822 [[Candida] duobushaemulonis]PVH16528.1 hypothetical protein CXQ87_004822 [[Candida] duobushaemulonis]QWU90290.1 hypothetical protein CA3LBN_004651 [[Candida] haemuloni]